MMPRSIRGNFFRGVLRISGYRGVGCGDPICWIGSRSCNRAVGVTSFWLAMNDLMNPEL
jgi:hypothetical protein